LELRQPIAGRVTFTPRRGRRDRTFTLAPQGQLGRKLSNDRNAGHRNAAPFIRSFKSAVQSRETRVCRKSRARGGRYRILPSISKGGMQ
jgi:hypothetical protein